GITIATATLFSLFIGFTLTPMLASRWLKPYDPDAHATSRWGRFTAAWERGVDRVAARYRGLLSWALSHRPVVVLAGFISLAVALSFIPLHVIGTEYAPSEDNNNLRIGLNMPAGPPRHATDPTTRH